jgi:hypothetical protein
LQVHEKSKVDESDGTTTPPLVQETNDRLERRREQMKKLQNYYGMSAVETADHPLRVDTSDKFNIATAGVAPPKPPREANIVIDGEVTAPSGPLERVAEEPVSPHEAFAQKFNHIFGDHDIREGAIGSRQSKQLFDMTETDMIQEPSELQQFAHVAKRNLDAAAQEAKRRADEIVQKARLLAFTYNFAKLGESLNQKKGIKKQPMYPDGTPVKNDDVRAKLRYKAITYTRQIWS